MQDLLEGADDAPLQPLVGDGHLAHLRLHRPQLRPHRLDTRLHPTNPLVEARQAALSRSARSATRYDGVGARDVRACRARGPFRRPNDGECRADKVGRAFRSTRCAEPKYISLRVARRASARASFAARGERAAGRRTTAPRSRVLQRHGERRPHVEEEQSLSASRCGEPRFMMRPAGRVGWWQSMRERCSRFALSAPRRASASHAGQRRRSARGRAPPLRLRLLVLGSASGERAVLQLATRR